MDPGREAGPSSFQCQQCQRSYKRPEHLQRHLITHSWERPHQCVLCKSTFQRSDVLRRHEKICNGTRQKAGSFTKRACDQCTKSKRACNSTRPCSACEKKMAACTYSVGRDKGQQILAWRAAETRDILEDFTSFDIPNYEDLLLDHFAAVSSEMLDIFLQPNFGGNKSCLVPKYAPSLQFLEGFTSNTGLVRSFDCGTESYRITVYSHFNNEIEKENCRQPTYDMLSLKSHEIVSLIKEVVQVKSRNSAVSLVWSMVLESMCARFFSPSRLRLYIELYWAIWHPNVPFIHRPTFNMQNAKAVLLAAMAVIGACVSPEQSDYEEAKTWFNCVEEMVFQDDDFCADSEDACLFPAVARVQSLQSAYLVCLYQHWEGSEASKRRIRRFRYSTVIAVCLLNSFGQILINGLQVARDIGITNARHVTPQVERFTEFCWEDFIVREQLIR